MDQHQPKRTGGRRRFLASTLTLAAGGAAGCGSAGSSWRFFTGHEGDTLTALCEQIIPADQDPGARWAQTAHYIDRQMLLRFRELGPAYRAGLASLDQASQARHAKPFAQLSTGDQEALLTEFEKQQPAFFRLAAAHTMQGFYGPPRHGGNRDGVSWRMLGLPQPPIRGRRKG